MIRFLKTGRTAEAKAEQQTQVRLTVENILGEIAARGEHAVDRKSTRLNSSH